jgi:hypothetical protein
LSSNKSLKYKIPHLTSYFSIVYLGFYVFLHKYFLSEDFNEWKLSTDEYSMPSCMTMSPNSSPYKANSYRGCDFTNISRQKWWWASQIEIWGLDVHVWTSNYVILFNDLLNNIMFLNNFGFGLDGAKYFLNCRYHNYQK